MPKMWLRSRERERQRDGGEVVLLKFELRFVKLDAKQVYPIEFKCEQCLHTFLDFFP